jgi:ubiquinone/menaquinone biosynthesis C-methylase UbiE
MQRDEYIEANRRKWNETAAIHARGYDEAFLERLKSPHFTTFDEVEQRIFAGLGLRGKAVIQLACNNGRELISVKKAGAGRCLGVDLSDEFIAQARRMAAIAGADVQFIRSSVYDLPDDLDGQFDIVYITIGVLGWMPDLDAFLGLVQRLLKPGGHLFIYEMHPILNMYDGDHGLVPDASYFRTEPFADVGEPDYLHPDQVVSAVSYWFPHTLSDVIGGCLRRGLALTRFQEYEHDISAVYRSFEKSETRLPLCYSLVARKPITEQP